MSNGNTLKEWDVAGGAGEPSLTIAETANPNAPNAFRFAEDGKLAGILQDAGATNIVERIVKFELAAPISAEEFWCMRSETSDTLRTRLNSFSAEQRRQIGDEVKDAVQ